MIFKLMFATSLAEAVQSVRVNGYISEGCHGERLHQLTAPNFSTCDELGSSQVSSASFFISDVLSGQTVYFSGNRDCSGDHLYSTNFDVCYTAPTDSVGSIKVTWAMMRQANATVERQWKD